MANLPAVFAQSEEETELEIEGNSMEWKAEENDELADSSATQINDQLEKIPNS